MVLENGMDNATTARTLVLATGFGAMAVVGCGLGSARDGLSPQNASSPAIDIPALKESALPSLAEGTQRIVNVGGGCVAELTIDPTLQRIVSDVLSRRLAQVCACCLLRDEATRWRPVHSSGRWQTGYGVRGKCHEIALWSPI